MTAKTGGSKQRTAATRPTLADRHELGIAVVLFERDCLNVDWFADSGDNRIRLLTPDNRSLLRTIRDKKPQSVAELARLTNRAEPNLLRTLGKLEAFGFLEMRTVDRRRVPTPVIKMLHFAIDPYSMADRIEISPAP